MKIKAKCALGLRIEYILFWLTQMIFHNLGK